MAGTRSLQHLSQGAGHHDVPLLIDREIGCLVRKIVIVTTPANCPKQLGFRVVFRDIEITSSQSRKDIGAKPDLPAERSRDKHIPSLVYPYCRYGFNGCCVFGCGPKHVPCAVEFSQKATF